ncbi:MAG: DNA-formamidopyrimidine glycosylase family protein [Woeseiaceae bacterium]|nr:DNA-formamidopyrimidine glycosylase family protein [Woeseiaceae bacterium]
MPEGDTIHKIATFLAPRLTAQTLVDVRMADAAAAKRCSGRRVDGVRARGKHLFIELDNDTALRSHLGMHGSWHRYAKGETWRKPRARASLVLETEDDDYVCFNAREIELVNLPSVRDKIVRSRLGPDLIADSVDFDYVARRARDILDEDALIVDALLDQRIASGIGNVYKSEVLFIERLAPTLRASRVTDGSIAGCFRTAASLLRQNLGGGRRVTRFDDDGAGRLWVYGRAGLPCLECDAPVATARMGRHHRDTYWCPHCQRADASPK